MKTGRRSFLLGSAAVPALAQTAGGGAIDCQSHLFVPELLKFMEKRTGSPRVEKRDGGTYVIVNDWVRRAMPNHSDVDAKLAAMDAAGIRMAALSINDPGPELFGAEGMAVARMVHDYLASITRKHPDRFFALMTLPLQDMPAALKEADRCVSQLGMKGILLYSNIGGEFPDERKYRPVFEFARSADIPVLLHPAYPMTYQQTKGYDMAAGLGLMFDTTIALSRLILAGVLDQQPGLKLVCPHVGGALPYLVGRIDHQTMVLKRGAENIRKAPSEYLKGVWFDSVSPIALAIRYGIDFAGPEKMLFSSDHPWVSPSTIMGLVKGLKLPAAQEAQVLSGNAKALFRL